MIIVEGGQQKSKFYVVKIGYQSQDGGVGHRRVGGKKKRGKY